MTAAPADSTLFDTRRTLIPFKTSLLPQIFCDTLVIGCGVAGLRAAIAAAGHGDTIMLGKDEPQMSNTAWAQGGIAAVTDAGDTVESHINDTLVAGAGLCDAPMVEQVVRRGPARIAELLEWGIRFDKDVAGRLKLGLEGGHSLHRILHADGDATGRELFRCLWERATATAGLRVFTKCFTLDLLTGEGGRVLGALTHHAKYGLQVIWAQRTILASGGAGMVYRETTNPRTATGDGIAMAFRAGASIADMAFVQFHPTCLYLAGAPRSLITEAIRGDGALLIDQSGKRFMTGVHPQAELAPRDVVTKGIVEHLAKAGGTNVYLDCRGIAGFGRAFPGIAALLKRYDLDASRDPIPVHPAQHYTIGGVWSDLQGRTTLPGLWAIGEAACSGLHGANRLASNSLLEGLVMGEIAGNDTVEAGREGGEGGGGGRASMAFTVPPTEAGDLDLADVESSLRSAMWRNVGIERSGARLRSSVDMIEFWGRYTLDKVFDDVRGWQVQNMLTVARLIAQSALAREESRGAHWRSDFPTPAASAVHDVVARTL
ncbi:MAG: L-aspartate oxidase [Phycisphaerales bacterium]|nr:L-aspartate oxidase [Phycisphaerales bacterium]